MSEQAKVEQRHERIASKTLEAMAYATNGNEEFKALAQALANAEAAGYAAGVKDEREACSLECEAVCPPAGLYSPGERSAYEAAVQDCAAAIRARSDAQEVKP